jgi:ribosomal protein S12 methylthiotransferase
MFHLAFALSMRILPRDLRGSEGGIIMMGDGVIKTYYRAPLGCPKNEIDSEAIETDLAAAGMTAVDDSGSADVIIVNSCGFINDARIESIHTVLDLNQERRNDSILVLCGCLPARYDLDRNLGEVDIFLPWSRHGEILERIREFGGPSKFPARNDFPHLDSRPITLRRMPPKSPYGYLRISEGCDNRCAYCAIPDIKGPFVSRSEDEILMEAEFLCSNGVKEIVLVGQDTTRYGKNLQPSGGGPRPTSLASLLTNLNRLSCDWIRIMYAHPAHLTDSIIDAIAESEKVVKYVDLPLQHINDRMFERMNRRVSRGRVEELIGRLRDRIPGIVLRTTFIVGFPGETDEEFAELLDFCEETRFDNFGVFKYSPEEGTPAYCLRGRVGEQVAEERYLTLLDLQNMISAEKQQARIGSRERVLLDGIDPDEKGHARGWFQAPEVDGQVIIESCTAEPGRFVDVVIERCDAYDLYANQLVRNHSRGLARNSVGDLEWR